MLGGMVLMVLQCQGRQLPKYQEAQETDDKCRTPSASVPERHLETSIPCFGSACFRLCWYIIHYRLSEFGADVYPVNCPDVYILTDTMTSKGYPQVNAEGSHPLRR